MSTEAPPAPAPEAPPVDPAPAPAPSGNPYGGNETPQYFSEGLTFAKDWVEKLPNEDFDLYRPTLAKFGGKTVVDLAKSYGALEKKLGARDEGMVKIPGEGATPEEISAYRRAAGIPETAEAYDSIQPKLPEGVQWDPAAIAPLKEIFLKHGGTPAMMNEMVEKMAEMDNAEVSRLTQEAIEKGKAEQEQLRKEWGQNYDRNLALSERVKLTGGGLPEGHWGHHDPHVQRLLASLGAKLSEGSMSAHEAAVANLGPGNAARDVVMNPDNPLHKAYHDSSHPNHEGAIAQYRALLAEQHRKD